MTGKRIYGRDCRDGTCMSLPFENSRKHDSPEDGEENVPKKILIYCGNVVAFGSVSLCK